MNRFKIFALTTLIALLGGCRDESTIPVPDAESAVHGWGRFEGTSPRNFVFGNAGTEITILFQWNSIDAKTKVNKIEFFAYFDESYVDSENNPRIARHGGRYLDANGGGKLFKTLTGSEIPANRTDITFKVKQSDIYNLYKDATFKYDGKTDTKVFANPVKPDRTAATPMIKGDAIEIGWILYTEDGRKFDFWSASICSTEFPKSSCTVGFGVVCTSDLAGKLDYVSNEFVKGDGAGKPTSNVAGEVKGTETWTQELDAASKPVIGSYVPTDLSFGHYGFVWKDDPAIDKDKKARIKDACNTLFISGTDQYGETWKVSVLKIDGKALTLRWSNTYNDAATTVLTRQDGKNWPALKSN
jgi:hypothetical protein